MSDTINFGAGWAVEHEGWDTSYVYHNGEVVRKFTGSETSWQDAERYASDKMFEEMSK